MTRGRSRPLPASDDPSVSDQTPDLAAEWQALFGTPAPARLAAVIAQGLAWQRQVAEHGDVARGVREDLRLAARDAGEARARRGGGVNDGHLVTTPVAAATSDPLPQPRGRSSAPEPMPPASAALVVGTRLVKLHGGITHIVEVTEAGLLYEGRVFTSLSAIAKVITGTHWNGLLFFGLRRRKTYPAKAAAHG